MTGARASARRAATSARLAWCELRRDPRQGLLVALLVALPATVLTTVSVVSQSQQPTPEQFMTSQLGANEAWVQIVGAEGAPVWMDPGNPAMYSVGDPPNGDSLEADAREVADLFPDGTRILSLEPGNFYVASSDGELAGTFPATVGPAWDPAFAGMADVVAGSAPTDEQVMVSSALAKRWGLEVGDSVTVGRDGVAREISGVIDTPLSGDDGQIFGSEAALAPGLDSAGGAQPFPSYLPDLELDWDAVQALNANGVLVYSRAVTEDPPAEYLATAEASGESLDSSILIGMGLGLVEVLLLAGAAFTVSMRRRQERLALLAATGAGRATLVGVGVWNGAILGLAGGLMGIPVGLGVAALWLWILETWGDVYSPVWGFHIAWLQLVAIAAFTTAAGALAALVPAIASARRDVLASLRGSRKPGKARRWPAVLGGVLVVGAGVALGVALRLRDAAWDAPFNESNSVDTAAAQATLAAALLLIAGALALTPAALRLTARVLGRVSLSARLASRDAARHLGRTVPVVAAIAITVAAAGNIALAEMRNAQYYDVTAGDALQAQPGDAYVSLSTWDDTGQVFVDAGPLTDVTQAEFPGTSALAIDVVQTDWDSTAEVAVAFARLPEESTCPAWDPEAQWFDYTRMTKRDFYGDVRCANGSSGEVYGLAVGGVEQFEYIAGRPPTTEEAAALSSGGAVVFDPLIAGPDAVGGDTGTMRVEVWEMGGDAPTGETAPVAETDVPVIVATPEAWVRQYPALLSPEAAASVGASVVPGTLYLHRDAGFTPLEQDELEAALMREGEHHVYVERPIDFGEGIIAWGSLIATLLVAGAAAGLSLGLARADARRDDLTLASLGASPGLARSVAAWQGGILVALAVWMGMAGAVMIDVVGALERSVSSEFAWGVLVIGVVAPPLVVAGLAWVMTKVPKAVHYRLAA
ncbi:hypothetical protein [Demequina sp.]|uniref:hypothetical protein n=1 Tax=Demequina sp. TaxID=2050685 RepID=UPI003A89B31D